MRENLIKAVGLTGVLVIASIAIFVFRPDRTRTTHIVVVGDAEEKVAPDTAVITFSVITEGKQAVEAQQENARRSEAVKLAVESIVSGTKADVQTSDYNVDPQRDYSSDRLPKIRGYDVKNTVSVTIDALEKVGAVIDAATKAGANSVEGIQYGIGTVSSSRGQALAAATRQAIAKAESIAQAMNGHLGRIIETTEGGAAAPRTQFEGYANAATNGMAAKPSITTPIQSGSLKLQSQVTLVAEVVF